MRGVVADPQSIVVCSGAAQGFVLLARALQGPRIAVEDPGLPPHRAILTAHGASLEPLPVDDVGRCTVERRCRGPARGGPVDAVLVTPAHSRRPGWRSRPRAARRCSSGRRDGGPLVIEDDYDAEYPL